MQRIPRRQFTDDFKSQAVVLAESVGTAKAARQLDISAKTLANWLTTSRSGKPPSSSARQPISELEAELARLRTENATLRMEREILKNVWSAPDLQASIPSEQNVVCVNVSGLLVQQAAAGLDGISAHRAP